MLEFYIFKPDLSFILRSTDTPTLINELCGKHVSGVACAATYCCAYTLGGELYTWGRYSDEQTTPTIVAGLKGHKVVDVACGESQIVALMETGENCFFEGDIK